MLSADKTTATADNTDAVTISLKYSRNGSGIPGATVKWSSDGGQLSADTSTTGSAGGAKVKLTSDTEGVFTVTAEVDGITAKTDTLTFSTSS
ncbi:Ig-like domain-containing protein [Cronobacter turicensis]|uniref:Ig-like domain-containing protein n=1 Tax=Cronobacter turicensis TaxID=413502 RepID=UPI001AA1A7B8|nr:Ig-like domain-containing protein [Cronobacter turicensis]EKY3200682.1 Ig-like domain-containing protein [Cronobacter turicensis]EKY3213509.1 Ig-like domain-containing protein [Cronobacter turicensis]EKY3216354.1 Ig-like domain-containing protein [Cronobacter turicensis]